MGILFSRSMVFNGKAKICKNFLNCEIFHEICNREKKVAVRTRMRQRIFDVQCTVPETSEKKKEKKICDREKIIIYPVEFSFALWMMSQREEVKTNSMANGIKIVYSIPFHSFVNISYSISIDLFSMQKVKRNLFLCFLNIFFQWILFFFCSVQTSISFVNNKGSFFRFNVVFTIFWWFFPVLHSSYSVRKMEQK